jgi:hypothetical protein
VAHPPTCRGAFLEDGTFAEFKDLYQRMSQLLDGAFDGWQPTIQARAPHAELSETDQAYVAEIELPGVARDDISVELAGQELATSGEFRDSSFRHARPGAAPRPPLGPVRVPGPAARPRRSGPGHRGPSRRGADRDRAQHRSR